MKAALIGPSDDNHAGRDEKSRPPEGRAAFEKNAFLFQGDLFRDDM
jgi:hypothetical protein